MTSATRSPEFYEDRAFAQRYERIATPYLRDYAADSGYGLGLSFEPLQPDFTLTVDGETLTCDVKAHRPHLDNICVELYRANGERSWGFTYNRVLTYRGKDMRWYWLDLDKLREKFDLTQCRTSVVESSGYTVAWFSPTYLTRIGALTDVTFDVEDAYFLELEIARL